MTNVLDHGADRGGSADCTTAIQQALDARPPGHRVVFPQGVYRVGGLIQIRRNVVLDFGGSTIRIDSGFTQKGFTIPGDVRADHVVLQNGIFEGDGTPAANDGPVISSTSGLRLGVFQIDRCVFRKLTYGCVFNCQNGGYIRNAILSNCLFEDIVGNDERRGKGAAFALRQDKGEIVCGRSYGNTFIRCGRHSLYVSTGGPFLSHGDAFFENNVGGSTSYPLAAISLARASHMRVTDAYFQRCRDGISLTSEDHGADLHDVSISHCTFVDQQRHDLYLNNDNADFGMFRNVVVQGTRHITGVPGSVPILVLAFQNMVLRDIDIDASRDPDKRYGCLTVYGNGDSNDLLIENVRLRLNPGVDVRRGLSIAPNAFSTANGPRIRIHGIDSNASEPVFTNGRIINRNLKVDLK